MSGTLQVGKEAIPIFGARRYEPQRRPHFKTHPFVRKRVLTGQVAAGHRPVLRPRFDNTPEISLNKCDNNQSKLQ